MTALAAVARAGMPDGTLVVLVLLGAFVFAFLAVVVGSYVLERRWRRDHTRDAGPNDDAAA
ncbi:MAG: hypothetical protein JO148_03240 [Acidimicrobiia bacterium]|nr:hypothetical protein [Acidimicrobiia bacterium]